jgi:hypothetical protein
MTFPKFVGLSAIQQTLQIIKDSSSPNKEVGCRPIIFPETDHSIGIVVPARDTS